MDIIKLIVTLVILVAVVAGFWKTFEKAGEPGWAAIVPIYNVFVLLKIAGKPWWWFIFMLVPIANFVVAVLIGISVAARFGKGAGFGLGLVFLGFIFYPILGFGDAEFNPSPTL